MIDFNLTPFTREYSAGTLSTPVTPRCLQITPWNRMYLSHRCWGSPRCPPASSGSKSLTLWYRQAGLSSRPSPTESLVIRRPPAAGVGLSPVCLNRTADNEGFCRLAGLASLTVVHKCPIAVVGPFLDLRPQGGAANAVVMQRRNELCVNLLPSKGLQSLRDDLIVLDTARGLTMIREMVRWPCFGTAAVKPSFGTTANDGLEALRPTEGDCSPYALT